MAGVRCAGVFTCVGWQVALCDHMWQVTSRNPVAVICQVAPVSSLHTPPAAVVGRLPVVEGYAFPPDNRNLTLRDAVCSVKLTAVYACI